MKKLAMLLLTLSFAQVQFAGAATELECNKEFGQNVSNCSQSVDTNSLDPQQRSAVHKACIDDAKAAKVVCQSGVNQCLVTCKATQTAAISSCQSSFDPDSCGGNAFCEGIIISQRQACIGNADAAFASCQTSCEL